MNRISFLITLFLCFFSNESFARVHKYFRLNSISAKVGINNTKLLNPGSDIPSENYLKIKVLPAVSVNFFKRKCIQHKIIASYNIATFEYLFATENFEESNYYSFEFINGAYAISIFPPNRKIFPYLDFGPFISVYLREDTPWEWEGENFNKVTGGLLTNFGIKYENDNFDIFIEISRNGYVVPLTDANDNYEYWISSYFASLGISLKF